MKPPPAQIEQPEKAASQGEEHEGEVGGENKLGSEASEHSAGLGERGAV